MVKCKYKGGQYLAVKGDEPCQGFKSGVIKITEIEFKNKTPIYHFSCLFSDKQKIWMRFTPQCFSQHSVFDDFNVKTSNVIQQAWRQFNDI